MSKQNEKSITELLDSLDEIAAWFESDEFTLEAAFDKFSEAEKITREVEEKLSEFKHKITLIKEDFSK